MSLSKLAAQCQVCPHVDTCDHKRMEALGYLPLPEQNALVEMKVGVPENLDDFVRHSLQFQFYRSLGIDTHHG